MTGATRAGVRAGRWTPWLYLAPALVVLAALLAYPLYQLGLISVLGAYDAVRYAQIHADDTFNYTPYLVAGLLFVLLAWMICGVLAALVTFRWEPTRGGS